MLHLASALVATATLLSPATTVRPLTTDRPTLTFAPTSVDAGHLQLETDVLLGAYNGDDGSIAIGGSTLRVGLTSQTDLQLAFPTLVLGATGLWTSAASTSISRGGAFAVRLKWNVIGNDGSGFALGVLPALAIDANDVITASVIFPISVALPADFTLGGMLQLDLIKPGDLIDGRGLITVVMSHPIVERVSGYFEAQADVRSNVGQGGIVTPNLLGSVGAAWLVADSVQLDAGMRVPLTGVAPTLEAFLGVSLRH